MVSWRTGSKNRRMYSAKATSTPTSRSPLSTCLPPKKTTIASPAAVIISTDGSSAAVSRPARRLASRLS